MKKNAEMSSSFSDIEKKLLWGNLNLIYSIEVAFFDIDE